MSTKQKDEKHVVYSVKVSPDQVAVLDKICETIGVNSYQMFQMFAYTMARAAAPQHELDPRIRKVMTMMETDASWAKAFNLANPNELDVAQVVLILQQKDKRGFGAVMIDRPFMDKARMTECTDDILERAVNISVGVVDKGLGAGTGINVNSTEEEINQVAKNIREIILSL